jgi:serine protease Do
MRTRMMGCLLAAVLTGAAASVGHAGPVDPEGERLAALAQKVQPALVQVHFVLERRTGGDVPQKASGMVLGLVVDDKGLVITLGEIYPRRADRVIGAPPADPPTNVRMVFADGAEVPGEFLGKDYDVNLSFLRLKTPPPGFTPLPMAPAGSLRVGQPVSLFGLMPRHYGGGVWFDTVRISSGIAKPREIYFTTVQSGRTLGGPVLDAEGRLVGLLAVDTRTVAPENDPTAPPRDQTAACVVPVWAFAPLIAKPPVVRPARQDGWLGIGMAPLSRDLAEALDLPVKAGVMVSALYPNTPAADAGMKAEDVIAAVDGRPLLVTKEEDLSGFRRDIVTAGAGAKLVFTVYRAGQKLDLPVTLGPTPKSEDEAEREKLDDFGLTARETVFSDRLQAGASADLAGVVVAAVEPAGWAGLGGLRKGDLVQKVNDRVVKSLAEFRQAVQTARAAKAKEVVFFIKRGAETSFVRTEPQWK